MFADQGGPNKGGTTHPSGLQGPCAHLPRLCILCTHRGAAWGLFPGHPLKVAKFSLPCGSPGRRVPMDASQGTRASRGCPQRVPTRGLLLLLTLPLDVFGSFYEHIIPLFLLCKTQAFLSPHMPLRHMIPTPGSHRPPIYPEKWPMRNLWNVPRKCYHDPGPIVLSTQEGKLKKNSTREEFGEGREAGWVRTTHFFSA